MPRQYEAVYVLDSALDDDTIKERLERFHALLGSPADLSSDHWGRRQLAYQIGRRDAGYYIVERFSAEPAVLPEFERALKLDDGVLRYLIALHEHELGAPPMSAEELEAAARRREEDDEDEE
ncbi:MAG TPA: 30S ribosomal protein S6 [Gemmatimonadaceae bacterium]|nr:30S ribosomal protein S6 [Gemmatimonadaceae bacterium]